MPQVVARLMDYVGHACFNVIEIYLCDIAMQTPHVQYDYDLIWVLTASRLITYFGLGVSPVLCVLGVYGVTTTGRESCSFNQ